MRKAWTLYACVHPIIACALSLRDDLARGDISFGWHTIPNDDITTFLLSHPLSWTGCNNIAAASSISLSFFWQPLTKYMRTFWGLTTVNVLYICVFSCILLEIKLLLLLTLYSVDWTKHCVIQQGRASIAFNIKHACTFKYYTIYMPIHTDVSVNYIVPPCKTVTETYPRCMGTIGSHPPSKSHMLWSNRHRAICDISLMFKHEYTSILWHWNNRETTLSETYGLILG